MTPDETMTLLIQAGLFDTAFTLASSFNLSRDAIFEGIAARLVQDNSTIVEGQNGGYSIHPLQPTPPYTNASADPGGSIGWLATPLISQICYKLQIKIEEKIRL